MIPFHQYQRYKLAELLINPFKKDKRILQLLEVGANSHKNLSMFFPEDKILYLDVELPEELLDDPDFIIGDATKLDYEDNSFEIVVALDVIEHVIPEKREAFLKEIYRVAKIGVVISAPYLNEKNEKAEERVASYYKAIFGHKIPWQEEHAKYGLPKIEQSLMVFRQLSSTEPIVIRHGNPTLWERLMRMEFLTGVEPNLSVYWDIINEFYNKELFDFDFALDGIRAFIIALKDTDAASDVMNAAKNLNLTGARVPSPLTDELNELETSFYRLYSVLQNDRRQKSTEPSERVQLFLDTGSGFSEEESISTSIPIRSFDNKLSFNISDQKKINKFRFDPANHPVALRLLSIEIILNDRKRIVVENFESNAHLCEDSILIFDTEDPQIALNVETINARELIIRIDYLDYHTAILFAKATSKFEQLVKGQLYQTDQLENITQAINGLTDGSIKEIFKLQNELLSLEKKIAILNDDLNECRNQITLYESSTSWKLTAPLRKITELLKKIRR